MALRSRSRTATPTSGPGRGPSSDGRIHRHPADRPRARHRTPAPAEELRRRAELLFGERAVHWPESGNSPPDGRPPANTASVTGPAPGLRSPSTAPPASGGTRGAAQQAEPAVAAHGADPVGLHDTQPADVTGRFEPAGRLVPGLRERTGLALRERLPVWLQTRCGVERRGVIALAVVLVAAAVFAVQHFWAGRTETVSAPQVVHAEASYAGKDEDVKSGRPTGASSANASSTGASTAPAPEIVVD
ncbi:ComEA family DNA-binding protein, partial [Streptomyces sp. SAS_269]